jgi:hypothetical protein
MSWRLAKSLVTLREQINHAHPRRSKKSDGTVGDLSHRARKSDHNPNRAGVVQAIDITHDPAGGFDSYKFAELLRNTKDRRVKYVISNRRIFSSTTAPWQWRKYSGSNPHSQHVHVSVMDNPALHDNAGLWQIMAQPKMQVGLMEMQDEPAPEPTEEFPDKETRCHWEDVEKGEEVADANEGEDEVRGPNNDPSY